MAIIPDSGFYFNACAAVLFIMGEPVQVFCVVKEDRGSFFFLDEAIRCAKAQKAILCAPTLSRAVESNAGCSPVVCLMDIV